MRVLVSRIFLAAGVLALAACLLLGAAVIRSYRQAVARDDFAGVGLGIHFLLYIGLPLTLALLLGGGLLNPPTRVLRHLGLDGSGAPGLRPALIAGLAGLSLVGTGVVVVGVVYFVGANLVTAARYYGYGPAGLGRLLAQTLVLSAPLLSLGGLLAWTGRVLMRPA